MKYIKKIIILLIIIIIIIITCIITILSKNNRIHENRYSYDNESDTVAINTNVKQVDNASLYFTVYNCLEKFVKTLNIDIQHNQNYDNYIEGGEISDSSMLNVYDEEDKNLAILNMLDKNYVDQNSITISNISDNFEVKNINNTDIKYMYIKDGEIIKSFYIYLDNNKVLIELYLDVENKTFCLKPVKYISQEDLLKQKFNDDIEKIEKNSNNSFTYEKVTDEDMAKKYFNYFKLNLYNNVEKYYYILDEEYRNVRYGSFENFKNYIEENKNEFEQIKISKFLINNYDNYKEYVCKDQYDNIYIFDEKYIMDYTIKLDTYTISSDKFNTEYNEANDEKKVQMNVDKFVQMINRQDYKTSYSYLDENFKNNYFTTENKFKEYTKDKFFLYNSIEFKNIQKKGNNLYVCNLQLTDITNENNKKEIIIIMKLNEGTDFKMSLNME